MVSSHPSSVYALWDKPYPGHSWPHLTSRLAVYQMRHNGLAASSLQVFCHRIAASVRNLVGKLWPLWPFFFPWRGANEWLASPRNISFWRWGGLQQWQLRDCYGLLMGFRLRIKVFDVSAFLRNCYNSGKMVLVLFYVVPLNPSELLCEVRSMRW